MVLRSGDTPGIFLQDDHNHYPYGIHWKTGHTFDGECYLPPIDRGNDSLDVIFQIDYCKDILTRVGDTSWGKLKLRYRK